LSVTDAVCIVVPAVPVIVIVLSPKGVVPLVPIVSVVVLANASVILTEVGLKLAFAPAGNPVALKFTVPVNPANGVIVIEYCALLPGVTARDDGVTLIAKSGVAEAGADVTKVRYMKSPELLPSLFA
jgi:hypothetical protein